MICCLFCQDKFHLAQAKGSKILSHQISNHSLSNHSHYQMGAHQISNHSLSNHSHYQIKIHWT